MKFYFPLVLVLFSILLWGNKSLISGDSLKKEEEPTNKMKEKILLLLGGDKALNIISHFDKVEISRMIEETEKKIISAPITIIEKQSDLLSKLLTNYKSYVMLGENKKCLHNWSVMISFQKEKEKVDVYFCFACNCIQFGEGREEIFDPMSKELIAIIKPLFPNDKKIQDLK